jgi:hypothetical protein
MQSLKNLKWIFFGFWLEMLYFVPNKCLKNFAGLNVAKTECEITKRNKMFQKCKKIGNILFEFYTLTCNKKVS